MTPFLRASAVALLLAAAGTAGAADLPGDPSLGRALADPWCGACHDVEAGGVDVYGGVPSLQTVADDAAVTELSLRVFLQTPHAEMPNVMPTREETDHLIAYILSLKGR